MKKLLIISLGSMLLLGSIFLTYAKDSFTSGNEQKTCDINEDGKIDKSDIEKLTDLILNNKADVNKHDFNDDGDVSISDVMICSSEIVEDEVEKTCDINEDGKIDESDVKKLADLITKGLTDVKKHDFNNDGDVSVTDVMICSSQIVEENNKKECEGMDKAKISHTINNDTITLKWNIIEGNNVEIAILDPNKETYKNLGKVKMSDKTFNYKIEWDGEQNFKLSNECNEYIYKVDIKATTKCKGMENANVSHTINNDTITLKWVSIEGDNIKISIYDPENKSYKNLGTIKMNDKKFSYKVKREGEQKFLLTNGCDDYYYKVNIQLTNNQNSTSDFGTISINNPENPSEGFTIMDRNLGATKKGAGKNAPVESYGYYYQWGNNYGFQTTGEINKISTAQVNASKYGPSNPYSNSTFISRGEKPYNRDSSNNNNLWGYESNKNIQGPCPEGYHIPSIYEWSKVLEYWIQLYNKENLTSIKLNNPIGVDLKYIGGTDIGTSFSEYFYIPYAGARRYGNGSTFATGEWSNLWSISPSLESSDHAYYLYVFSNSISTVSTNHRSFGHPIRCFKDTYEPTSKESNLEVTEEKKQIKCDINDDGEVSVSDLSRFNEHCSVTKGRDSKKCDINGDGDVTVSDITLFQNKCYEEIMGSNIKEEEKENNDSQEEKEVSKNGFTKEMNDAYEFAFENGITTINNIESTKMYSTLTRIQMAKMLSNYAVNVLGKEPDTSKKCQFDDISKELDAKYDKGVTKACQLGIMGQNVKRNQFRPNDIVTRAEFTTALSRMLYGIEDGKGNTKYYEPHMAKLYEEGIITKKDPKIKEKRGYVMLMLMRTAE